MNNQADNHQADNRWADNWRDKENDVIEKKLGVIKRKKDANNKKMLTTKSCVFFKKGGVNPFSQKSKV